MQREYATSCSDEPWPTSMVKNQYCLDNTEEDTIYKPNAKHRVPFIDIPEKLTTTEKRADKSSTNQKKCQNYWMCRHRLMIPGDGLGMEDELSPLRHRVSGKKKTVVK